MARIPQPSQFVQEIDAKLARLSPRDRRIVETGICMLIERVIETGQEQDIDEILDRARAEVAEIEQIQDREDSE